jgi:lipoprotein-releasing system permease protein
LDLSRFIAARLRSQSQKGFSAAVYRVAVWSVGIGLGMMVLSVCVLDGFKQNIKLKLFSLSAHMVVTRYDRNNSFDDLPITRNNELFKGRKGISKLQSMEPFARKSALLKSSEEITGVLFKGIDLGSSSSKRLQPYLKTGVMPGIRSQDSLPSLDVLLSEFIASKLNADEGDSILLFFVQDPPRIRKVCVKGIYQTNLEEIDEVLIIGDLRLVQQVNGWNSGQIGGYELILNDFNKLDETAQEVFDLMDYNLQIEKVTDLYIQLFDWLLLLNNNVIIFIVLITTVAVFNVGSSLLVMVMERTHMIGTLKSMGANDKQIGKIFYWNGLRILLIGMLFGNLVSLSLCAIQKQFSIIPLDIENYYMATVPISYDWVSIAALNVLMALVIILVLLVPTYFVAKIKPILAIRFN